MLGAGAAYTFLKNVASKGGRVLFVGTKKGSGASATEAARAKTCLYIDQRWRRYADQLCHHAFPWRLEGA